jgi:hypothetical protein
MAARRPERRIKKTVILDADMVRWIDQKAQTQDVSDSHIVRQIIRAAMDAEYRARRDDVDVEQGGS